MKDLLQEQLISNIRSVVVKHCEDIKLIYLFGSHANGKANSQSDIDIAVLGKKKLASIARWEWQNELAIALKTDVDLVDLLSASTVMQSQIIHNGICIYGAANFDARSKCRLCLCTNI